jgi:hypothetical protein
MRSPKGGSGCTGLTLRLSNYLGGKFGLFLLFNLSWPSHRPRISERFPIIIYQPELSNVHTLSSPLSLVSTMATRPRRVAIDSLRVYWHELVPGLSLIYYFAGILTSPSTLPLGYSPVVLVPLLSITFLLQFGSRRNIKSSLWSMAESFVFSYPHNISPKATI